MMQDKENADENSKLFKEAFDAVLHHYAAKQDSSIKSAVPKYIDSKASRLQWMKVSGETAGRHRRGETLR